MKEIVFFQLFSNFNDFISCPHTVQIYNQDVMLCRWVTGIQHFKGMCCLHYQGVT